MAVRKKNILFWIGIITAIWFACTGMIWPYWACLFIGYPIGLISYFIWRTIKKNNEPRNKFIPRILILGLILSISVLIYLLIFH
jgi:nicotinamide riboside transporter PnuC